MKQDVLAIIQPLTKVLQESEIIFPALISSCQRSIKIHGKLGKLLNAQGVEAFSNTENFSSTANMLNYVQLNEEEVIPQRATRNATRENPANSHSLLYDFLLSGESRKPRSVSLESSNLSLTVFINLSNQDSARLCKKQVFLPLLFFLTQSLIDTLVPKQLKSIWIQL